MKRIIPITMMALQLLVMGAGAPWLFIQAFAGEPDTTHFPSSAAPDQIVLSWEGDPRFTQTITWRTDTTIAHAVARYQMKKNSTGTENQGLRYVSANTERLVAANLANDRCVYRHSVNLKELQPGTAYHYSVGDSSNLQWSGVLEFTTAPNHPEPFSFIYMGDAQVGMAQWGQLLKTANQARPDYAFILLAGDLVNHGNSRCEWDSLLYYAAGSFAYKPFMPTLGNHDCQGGHPTLYLSLFHLPANGPQGMEPERAYSFEYGNALFIVLDSNDDFAMQAAWMDAQLSGSRATWKFVIFHHPFYSSREGRDNAAIRSAWLPIFDKYHVDVVLQGHDHAYLRTYPMRNDQRVTSPKEGTIYLVSMSGSKMYKQGDFDYIEKGITNTPTFQILDIKMDGDQLIYHSLDSDGKIVDEFEIKK